MGLYYIFNQFHYATININDKKYTNLLINNNYIIHGNNIVNNNRQLIIIY